MHALSLAFISFAVILFNALPVRACCRHKKTLPSLINTPAPTKAPTKAPTPGPTKAPTTEPTKAPTPPPTAPLTVGVFYYPWHINNFHGGQFLRNKLQPAQYPALGLYNDRNMTVIRQQLQWCMDSNIFLWVTSWWGPYSREDNTTTIILDYMKNQTSNSTFPINSFKTAIFYESSSRIPQIGTTNTYNTSRVKGDIEYMATKYFNHPNYLKIGDRPVVFVYLTRSLYSKNSTKPVYYANLLEEVIDLMRQGASNNGFTLYIIGDHAFGTPPANPYAPFTLLNAVVNYDVFGSMGRPLYANDNGVANYASRQQGWSTSANNENCDFIPSISPGFNKAGYDANLPYGPMSRRLNSAASEGSLFKALLTNALKLVDNDIGILMINSFNEWHEDTHIECVGTGPTPTNLPTNLTRGLVYEAYGSLYLDIVKSYTK
jgi:hypothetical protein